MKIKPKIYAKALVDLIVENKNKTTNIVERFLRLLEKNGDIRKAKEILVFAEDLFIKKTGRRKIITETARKITPRQKELLKSVERQGDIVSERINKDLIAGIKIIVNDNQLDMSMQKKLQNIFK